MGLDLATQSKPYVTGRKPWHALIRSKNRGQYGGINNNSKAGSVLRANLRGDFKPESLRTLRDSSPNQAEVVSSPLVGVWHRVENQHWAIPKCHAAGARKVVKA
jgi:hypothetical protein